MTQRYQVGGALRPGALYIPRAADDEAEAALLAGDAIHVLGPRQLGKSSLRLRLAARLAARGLRVAHLDLSGLGAARDAQAWVAAIADELAMELGDASLETLTRPGAGDSSLRHLSRLLARASEGGPWVLFVDEVDTLISHPEAADAFLGALRAAWDSAGDRAERPFRLCLSGVVAPFELGADPNRTPFNISRPVLLVDFSRAETSAFALDFPEHEREALADAIYAWAAGHPYMSHRLAERIAAGDGDGAPESRVAELVARLFLQGGVHGDANLAGAARRLAAAGEDAPEMLALYRRALLSEGIEADGRRAAVVRLLLTGLVVWRAGPHGVRLCVRNRVYAAVFDLDWVNDQLDRRPFVAALDGWVRAGRQDDWLLRGAALEAAQRWAAGRVDLGQEEMAFLLRSAEVWTGEQEGRAEIERLRLARALADEQHARQRQRGRALVAVLGLAALIVVVLVVAYARLSEANLDIAAARDAAEAETARTRRANAAMLLDRARAALRVPDYATAELAASASLVLADTPAARGVLLQTRAAERPTLLWQVPVAGGFATGKLLASVDRVVAPDAHDLTLRDAATGALIHRLAGAGDDARALTETALVARASFQPVSELALADGALRRTLAVEGLSPDQTIEDLAVSADGASMFMNTGAHRLSRWALADGRQMWSRPSPGPARCKIARRDATLAVGCTNGVLDLVDGADGQTHDHLEGRGAITPIWAEQWLYLAGDLDGRGHELQHRTSDGGLREVSAAELLPWGVWRPLARGESTVRTLAFDGATVWASLRDGTVLGVDAALAAPVTRFRAGAGALWLAVAGGRLFTLSDDGLLRGWALPPSGARAGQTPLETSTPPAFWQDDQGVLAAIARTSLQAREPASGRLTGQWTVPARGAAARLLRAGGAIWVGTDLGEVLRQQGEAWQALSSADGVGVMALAASDDGAVVAALRDQAPLWVWRDAERQDLPCGRRAGSLALSRDGRWLAAGCNGDSPQTLVLLRIWDLRAPGAVTATPLAQATAGPMVWLEGGRRLLVGTDEGQLLLWSPEAGLAPWGSATSSPVVDLSVSPDGRRVAIGDQAGTVRITTDTGTELATLTGLPRMAVSLDLRGGWLTARLVDGAVVRWPLDALDLPAQQLYDEASARWGLAIDGGEVVNRAPPEPHAGG